MQDNRDELDRLLDSALATYADPGAEFGLEQRVLSRMASEAVPAPRRSWLPWAIAAPMAAVVLLFAVLSVMHRAPAPFPAGQQQARISRQPFAPPDEAANRRLVLRPEPVRRGETSLHKRQLHNADLAAQPAQLPKLDVFPTPQPLSPQEQLLVNFAAQATKSQRESVIAAQQRANAPVRIAAIEIKPLAPLAAGAN